jgi:hypothetical protein
MILNIHTVETATPEELLADCKEYARNAKLSIGTEILIFRLLESYNENQLRAIWKHNFNFNEGKKKQNADRR